MSSKRQKISAVKVHTRVKDYKGVFRADNGLLFCNYCDLSVEWKHKSTIDAHCASKSMLHKKLFSKQKIKPKVNKQYKLLYLLQHQKRSDREFDRSIC